MTLLALTISATLAFPTDATADIFQYTDADGVVHFSNRSVDAKYKLYIRGGDPFGARRSAAVAVPPSDRELGRFVRYDRWIREAATLYQIPEELVRAVIKVESDYDPRAVSVAGARGLMQLMPQTAERMLVRDIDDPRENIFGGVRYLRVLANTFNGDLALTIAGYNAGEGAVVRSGGIPPYAETRGYVVKVSQYYRRYRAVSDPIEASVGAY